MLPSACGLGQHFQDLGHSFSRYGPPSRQITHISVVTLRPKYSVVSRNVLKKLNIFPNSGKMSKNVKLCRGLFLTSLIEVLGSIIKLCVEILIYQN